MKNHLVISLLIFSFCFPQKMLNKKDMIEEKIPDSDELEPVPSSYPCCTKCWGEWKENRVMVINEMRLDMSLKDHRKLLKKHEKVFVGVLTPEGDVVDYTNEDNRNPEESPA